MCRATVKRRADTVDGLVMTRSLQAQPEAHGSWVAEEARLSVLKRSRLLDSAPEPAFDRWTSALRESSGATVAALLLVDSARMFVKSLATADGCAVEGSEIPLLEPLAEYLIGRAHPGEPAGDPPAYAQAQVSVDGQQLGWIAMAGDPPREWNEVQLRTLQNAAASVSTEVRLRLANQEEARFRDVVASHNRLHELIARAAPLGDVLGELVEGIARYEPSVMPCVVLLDRETSTLHPGAGPSLPPHWLEAIDGVVIGPNIGTCGSAAWSGNFTITEDMTTDPKWAPVRELVIGAGLRHCWSMPIKAHDGEVLGTLAFYGTRPRLPLPEHLTLMEDGARLAGIAIERQRSMEGLIRDARHDGLTGLPNRAAIFERLDDAVVSVQPKTRGAVLFVDLDGLKTLNDTLGHDRADEMIREIGERLAATVRADEFVGRFGGDEFVVIAEGVDHQQAADLGARLLDAISKPLLGIESTVVTASVGIALINGVATDAREAIRQADSAMYAAKRAGRDGYSFFKGSRRIRTPRRQSLTRELRDAELRGEMSLVFAPIFDLASAEVVAVEALMRWNSPKFGEVSPVEFGPLAEDSGLIVPLGAWALRESCETLTRINADSGRPLELSVNVTAQQLAKPGFAQSVHQVLLHAEFPAELLALEVTEATLMLPDSVSARTLNELESLGVRIVRDDFGAGYSSLRWLRDNPHHGLKIDGDFIAGLPENVGDRAIVAGVIDMAKTLGCMVTAQGVTCEEQLDALRELGCERAQGSLISPPVAADELATHRTFRPSSTRTRRTTPAVAEA
jgi:diguanylate cyclase (GGDEF)-like protein